MTVKDCPDHPLSALQLVAGVFCFACGREVLDAGLVLVTAEAPAALVAEAHAEWTGNRTVAAFGTEARLAAAGMLGEATS